VAAVIKIVVNSSSSGSGIGEAKRDVQSLGDTASKAGGGFTVMKGVAVSALTAVGSAAIGAVASVGGFVADSVSAAATFESSLNGLAAVSGAALGNAGFSLEDVSAKALQLGADTQFSAQQAVEAMTNLAKGGVPVVDIMNGATDATLALASATGMDLAQSAEIVAKQLGVWSETGVTAAEVTDLLASAANASTVDVDELALGLANAGGTAKTAGVEFDDLVQTMALIAPNFSSASDAGTSLKTFISRLIPTTDSATEAMIALGLATEEGKSKFFDAQGSFIGMEQAAALLQQATAGLSEEERLLAFNTIFGADAIRTASAIANAGADGFNAMGVAMEESGGAAASAATKNQGFSFAMEQLKGSIETVQIVLGMLLLPVLTDFLTNVVTPGINQILTFAQSISASGDPITALATAIGLPSGALTTFIGIIQTALGWFSAQDSALTSLSTMWQFLQAAVEMVITAYQMYVMAIFGQVQVFIQTHGQEISTALSTAWTLIQDIVNTALPLIAGIITGVLLVVRDFINTHGTDIQNIIGNTWTIISNIVLGALEIIKGILQAALAVFRGDWEGAWEAIRSMSESVVRRIWEIIKAGLDLIANFFGTSLQGLITLWANNFEQMVAIVTNIDWSSVGASIIDGIVDGVRSAAGALADAAAQAAADALDAAKSALGISSPSKVFAAEIGMPMAQGMALGLAQGAPMVASAGAASASAAMVGASSVQNNQRNFTYSPTINNYGASKSGALDYAMANALSGV
jgi:TP901 family phage tail tape measure protein